MSIDLVAAQAERPSECLSFVGTRNEVGIGGLRNWPSLPIRCSP